MVDDVNQKNLKNQNRLSKNSNASISIGSKNKDTFISNDKESYGSAGSFKYTKFGVNDKSANFSEKRFKEDEIDP